MKTVQEKAVAWAKKIAKDNSHGYNATSGKRLGNPDYACTSFVAGAYRAAGVKVPLNSYSGSVKEKWKPYGFKDVADKVDLRTGEGVQAGDVVVRKGVHSAICINSKTHRLAEAVGNPYSGKPQNGLPGDQTGKEIKTRSWYDDKWNICLRYIPKGIEVI